MGTPRLIPIALSLVIGVEIAGAQATAQVPAVNGEGRTQQINASQVMLPCIPVGAYWTGPPPSAGMPPGPELAVVSINVRPKDARVHLDDRFVGRARYLDGKPGYLYLEPGTYDLELRFEGYQTVLVELDAKAACRYDLKHRLERSRGPSSEQEDDYGKGKPFNRVYGPLVTDQPAVDSSPEAGPDVSLRKDLDLESRTAADTSVKPGAALRLRVSPSSATVSVDGEFAATARELGLMEGPLAVTAGRHQVVVCAPGYLEVSREVELSTGEVLELEIILSENSTE
jgi:hypothetical protein